MKITVLDITTSYPVVGIPVSVDGTSAGSTDSNGQILSAPAGVLVESSGLFKILFASATDGDRDIWCETPMSGTTGMMMSGAGSDVFH